MIVPNQAHTVPNLPLSDVPNSGPDRDDGPLKDLEMGYRRTFARSSRVGAETENVSPDKSDRIDDLTWSSLKNRHQENIDDIVLPYSKRFPIHINLRSFSPTAEWEGYVEEIGDDDFSVRIVDIKSGSSLPEEVATFSKSELSQRDRKLLVPGAIVRWVIGLERLPTDQRRRVSELHFRNLPAHSIRDLDRARTKAKDLLDSILVDESP